MFKTIAKAHQEICTLFMSDRITRSALFEAADELVIFNEGTRPSTSSSSVSLQILIYNFL